MIQVDKYDTGNDYYCYPGTSVLKNKLNIKDESILENAEREITSVSIRNIRYSDPPYNIEYFKNLHLTLFSELYEWAGKTRDVDISKGGTRFCTAYRIIPEIEKIFSQLKTEKYLKNVAGNEFAKKLAEYYAEFNVIHPFREGNGRVQRLFFEHLAAYNGYVLDWSLISQDEWIKANIDGFNVQYQSLTNIFMRILSRA